MIYNETLTHAVNDFQSDRDYLYHQFKTTVNDMQGHAQEQMPLLVQGFVDNLNYRDGVMFDLNPVQGRDPGAILTKALRRGFNEPNKNVLKAFVGSSQPAFNKLIDHTLRQNGYAVINEDSLERVKLSYQAMKPLPEKFTFSTTISREQAFHMVNNIAQARIALSDEQAITPQHPKVTKRLLDWQRVLNQDPAKRVALEAYGMGIGLDMRYDGEMDWASAYSNGSHELPIKDLANRRTRPCETIRVEVPASSVEKKQAKQLSESKALMRQDAQPFYTSDHSDSAERLDRKQQKSFTTKIEGLLKNKIQRVPVKKFIDNHAQYQSPLEVDLDYFLQAVTAMRDMKLAKDPKALSVSDILAAHDPVFHCGTKPLGEQFVRSQQDDASGLMLTGASVRLTDQHVPVIDYNCQGLYTLTHDVRKNDFSLRSPEQDLNEAVQTFDSPQNAVSDLFARLQQSRQQTLKNPLDTAPENDRAQSRTR